MSKSKKQKKLSPIEATLQTPLQDRIFSIKDTVPLLQPVQTMARNDISIIAALTIFEFGSLTPSQQSHLLAMVEKKLIAADIYQSREATLYFPYDTAEDFSKILELRTKVSLHYGCHCMVTVHSFFAADEKN